MDHIRPQFSDIDAWGATHQGKVRPDNKDHFFQGSLIRGVRAEEASISEGEGEFLHVERLASLAVVADGVGADPGGRPTPTTC